MKSAGGIHRWDRLAGMTEWLTFRTTPPRPRPTRLPAAPRPAPSATRRPDTGRPRNAARSRRISARAASSAGELFSGAWKSHALRRRQQLDPDHARRVAGHPPRLGAGMGRHGDMVLLVGGGRHGVDAGRVGQALVLGDQGRGRHLGDHEARVDARCPRPGRPAGRSSWGRPGSRCAAPRCLPISHSAMASMSAAKATGSAWKLPPDSDIAASRGKPAGCR